VTSVLGHVNASDFGERYKSWRSCDPFDLFDAEIVESIGDVRPLLSS
jgi:DNA topoisomerase-3